MGFRTSAAGDVSAAESPAQGSPHLEIGSAGWRDLPAVAGVQRRAFPPRFAYTLSTLAILQALPWVRLLVARRDGAIVGCVIADRVLEGNRIVNLAVDPVAQRQGVGAALLHAAERALPSGDMTLMVQTGNAPARALYRRVGYEEESVHPHYYGPGRPGIKMRKRRGRFAEGEKGGASLKADEGRGRSAPNSSCSSPPSGREAAAPSAKRPPQPKATPSAMLSCRGSGCGRGGDT